MQQRNLRDFSCYGIAHRPAGAIDGSLSSVGQTDVELVFCLNGLRPEVSRASVLEKLMQPQPDGVESTFSHVWVTELTIDRLEWWKVRSVGPIAYGGFFANIYKVTLRLTVQAIADTPAEAVARWAARCFWQGSRFNREEGAPAIPADAAPLYAALNEGLLCNASLPPDRWAEDAPVPMACFRMARRTAPPITEPTQPPPVNSPEGRAFYTPVAPRTPWSPGTVALAVGAGVAGLGAIIGAIAYFQDRQKKRSAKRAAKKAAKKSKKRGGS